MELVWFTVQNEHNKGGMTIAKRDYSLFNPDTLSAASPFFHTKKPLSQNRDEDLLAVPP